MPKNPVKEKLARGETVVGTFVFEFDSPGLAKIAASAGAEYVIFDMEHSGWGIDTIKQQIANAHGAGLVPFVNVVQDDYFLLSRPLDLGACGLLVPVVETREQAERIVAATHYPPVGHRGSAFGVAHDGYVLGDFAATIAAANRDVMIIAKIETAKGMANAEDIISVPGLDAVFVGHTDLSVSMGIPGQFAHPDFVAARRRIAELCARHGKVAGDLVADAAWAREWMEDGYRMIAWQGDIWLYQAALQQGVETVRGLARELAAPNAAAKPAARRRRP